jgi:hypothetical protein
MSRENVKARTKFDAEEKIASHCNVHQINFTLNVGLRANSVPAEAAPKLDRVKSTVVRSLVQLAPGSG